MSLDKKCKCTHTKAEHRKPRIGKSKDCNVCQCNLYLSESRPDKADKIMMIFCGVMSVVLIATIFAIAYELSTIPDESINQTYLNSSGEEQTVGKLFLAVFGFTILIAILMDMMLLEIFFEIRNMSKRKDWN